MSDAAPSPPNRWVARIPLLQRLLSAYRPHACLTAVSSLILNLLYALYHGALGIAGRALWPLTLCAYDTVLSMARFCAVLYMRKTDALAPAAALTKRVTGALLALLSLVLSGVVYISLSRGIAVQYDTVAMIAIATYTFAKITWIIVRGARQRRRPCPSLTAVQSIVYAEAAVSLLTLQRSMLATFGSASGEKARMLNAAAGAAVCAFVCGLGVMLIIKGTTRKEDDKMAKSKLVQANEKIAAGVVRAYGAVEQAVVGGYTKVETAVVEGYTKLEDAFVGRYLTQDGETVEEAKQRLRQKTPPSK